jgi:3',5'-cyclic AMP phosphodiesterase CpdA
LDYLVISGDVANQSTPEEYEAACRLVSELIQSFELNADRVVIVPGNHDLNSPASVNVWRERYGSDRAYYHFIYKNVLFLMLNTEDPPKDPIALIENDPEQAKVLDKAYHAIKEAVAAGAGPEKVLELLGPIEEWSGGTNLSDAQVAYFKAVIEANPDVRWTFVMMHAPAWQTAEGYEQDPGIFAEIEDMLADRPYTVFGAHTHIYNHIERKGRDYITTAMTGAMNLPRPGAIDHFVWVTMTEAGPKIANVLLNGVMDKMGPPKDDALEAIGMYRPKA